MDMRIMAHLHTPFVDCVHRLHLHDAINKQPNSQYWEYIQPDFLRNFLHGSEKRSLDRCFNCFVVVGRHLPPKVPD